MLLVILRNKFVFQPIFWCIFFSVAVSLPALPALKYLMPFITLSIIFLHVFLFSFILYRHDCFSGK